MLLDAGRVIGRHAACDSSPRRLLRLPVRSFSTGFHRREDVQLPLPKNANPRAKKIAVLGGGISGLTAAYELALTIPKASVTLYEKSGRLGGWLESEVVQVKDGEVLFEWGARSFRPSKNAAGLAAIDLLLKVQYDSFHKTGGLVSRNKIITASKTTPAARNRFIYYPDHLVRLPNFSDRTWPAIFENIRSLFQEPLWKGVVFGLLGEIVKPPRDADVQDESVGDFLSRRLGPALTDNIVSAGMHGIYAGDIYKMSARTIMPKLWNSEIRTEGASMLMDLFVDGGKMVEHHDLAFMKQIATKHGLNLARQWYGTDSAFCTWPSGMSEWTRLLKNSLDTFPRVKLKDQAEVKSLTYRNSKVSIQACDEPAQEYDYVVSSLPPAAMRAITSVPTTTSSSFDPISKAVTVMVVNLYYNPPLSLPQEGFGYLIPRSVPMEQNPERALGVIFAHASSGLRGAERETTVRLGDYLHATFGIAPDLDPPKARHNIAKEIAELESGPNSETDDVQRIVREGRKMEKTIDTLYKDVKRGALNLDAKHTIASGQDSAEGLKFTVMLGGHWWDGWGQADYPSEKEAIKMAKNVIRRHLDITEEPAVAKARLQKDCIPQYPVGYRKYMSAVHHEMERNFHGQLKLAGPFYQGAVGIPDSIKQARWAAMSIRDDDLDSTGIQRYAKDERWWKQLSNNDSYDMYREDVRAPT